MPRLADLNARWVGTGGDGITDGHGNPVPFRDKIGVILDCPACGPDHPLFIPFANPPDGGPNTHPQGWQRTGNGLADMTLMPSILRTDRCGWHGFITNGVVLDVR